MTKIKKYCKKCEQETEYNLIIITRKHGKIFECEKCGYKKQEKIKGDKK